MAAATGALLLTLAFCSVSAVPAQHVQVVGDPRSSQGRFSCEGRTPGYYADTATGCQVYYVCGVDTPSSRLVCPAGTVFDISRTQCVFRDHARCSPGPSSSDAPDRPPPDHAKQNQKARPSAEMLESTNEVGDTATSKESLSSHSIKHRGNRARRNAQRSPKRFGFSFGALNRGDNDAKKREVFSVKRTTTTTKRPVPFWKQRTSTTKRPSTKPTASTTKRPFSRRKQQTAAAKRTTPAPTTNRPFPRWKQTTATTKRPASTPTTKRTFPRWKQTNATTKRPTSTPTAKRTFPRWKQTPFTAKRAPSTTTTKRPVQRFKQRTIATTKRPITTTKRSTTRRTITKRPKTTTRRTTTKQPRTTRTTTRRPKTTTRRTITKRPKTTRRTTTKRPTTRTTTRRPKTTTRRTTTKRPKVTRRPTTKRPTPRRTTTKRPSLATKRASIFSSTAAKRTQVTRRPALRFPSRKSPPARAVPKPTPTARPPPEVPANADPLTSLLMQIASLGQRRTRVGSPSVLLAIAALATPAKPDQPAVRLDPQQKGFHLSLKHQPQGECAPCMPTFLVDLENCHPCVVIR